MADAAERLSSAVNADELPMVGRILGDTFRVLAPLDEGGMGAVFEAEDVRFGARVAVKKPNGDLASRPDVLARFHQEADVMSTMNHPHVVKVLDFDVTEEGQPYLVLERLYGETLEKRLEREGRLEIDQAIEIALQIASALSAVHDKSVVHRDLKPSNVFLTTGPNGSVCAKLFDFGISKDLKSTRRLTAAHILVGTPEYMAPEQATGRNDLVDARTDQYALAVVAYEMLTGDRPFCHDNLSLTLKRVLTFDPPRPSSFCPSIPTAIDGVLARGLAKDRAARFESVSDFAKALAAAARTVAPPSSEPPESAIRRRSTLPGPTSPLNTVESELAKSRRASPAFGLERVGTASLGGAGDRREAPGERAASGLGIDRIAPSQSVAASVERARAALNDGKIAEATTHATAAVTEALLSEDPAIAALLRVSDPLLARVFMRRIGSPARRLLVNRAARTTDLPSSPRAAFVLSRIDDGITVEDLLDVTPFSRLEAMLYLMELVSAGIVRLAPARASAQPPALASVWLHGGAAALARRA
jgi:serine/threonine-protein kinase